MEDRRPDVISALKRLERAGDEQSRTTAKLRIAAGVLAAHIASKTGCGPLPRGWQADCGVNPDGSDNYYLTRGKWGTPERIDISVNHCSRRAALALAEEVATGWLDELAEWLLKRAYEDDEACWHLEHVQ